MSTEGQIFKCIFCQYTDNISDEILSYLWKSVYGRTIWILSDVQYFMGDIIWLRINHYAWILIFVDFVGTITPWKQMLNEWKKMLKTYMYAEFGKTTKFKNLRNHQRKLVHTKKYESTVCYRTSRNHPHWLYLENNE